MVSNRLTSSFSSSNIQVFTPKYLKLYCTTSVWFYLTAYIHVTWQTVGVRWSTYWLGL